MRKKGNQFFQNVAERLNFRLLALGGTPASRLQLPRPQAKEGEAGRSGGSHEGWLVTGTTCTPNPAHQACGTGEKQWNGVERGLCWCHAAAQMSRGHTPCPLWLAGLPKMTGPLKL